MVVLQVFETLCDFMVAKTPAGWPPGSLRARHRGLALVPQVELEKNLALRRVECQEQFSTQLSRVLGQKRRRRGRQTARCPLLRSNVRRVSAVACGWPSEPAVVTR